MTGYDSEWEGHHGSFEGATTQMVEHVLAEHADALSEKDIEQLAYLKLHGGFTQGEWIAADHIHAKAHGFGDGSGYPGTQPVITEVVVSSDGTTVATTEHPSTHKPWLPIAMILGASGVETLTIKRDGFTLAYVIRGKQS